jgi:capsular polysaccharide biosynthesis protein
MSSTPVVPRQARTIKEVIMSLHRIKYLAATWLAVMVIVSAVAFTKSNKSTPSKLFKEPQEKGQTTDTLPLVISQVKHLEVIKASLKNPGTPNPIAVLEIKNKSNKSVVAVSVETGEPEEAYGITVNGFKEGEEPPEAVIEPHGTTTIELPLNNAKPGHPIRVSGAVFSDDSEDGEKTALQTIRNQRKHTKYGKIKDKSPTEKILKGNSSPQ